MENLRKFIKKVLKESFGVHEPTDELAEWLSNELIANLNYYFLKTLVYNTVRCYQYI